MKLEQPLTRSGSGVQDEFSQQTKSRLEHLKVIQFKSKSWLKKIESVPISAHPGLMGDQMPRYKETQDRGEVY